MVLALTMAMMMMMGVIPTRVVAVAGADGMFTARRGMESVAGTKGAHDDIDDMRGDRMLQVTRSSDLLITNMTLLQDSRVVLTVTNVLGPSSGTIEGSRYLCKGDLRGIASSGAAQGNSSVLTRYWSSANLNGSADSADERLTVGVKADYWGFDLSRNERYVVVPVRWGLGFVNTMDGSRTTYLTNDINYTVGAFNPRRTILYVARDSCLWYSTMDGESPGTFALEPVACPTRPFEADPPWLTFSHRSFLQDGSYLYSLDSLNTRILRFDPITRTTEFVTGTRIQDYVADSQNPGRAFNLGEPALAQDGCNLFFVADGAANIRWVAFDKPGGKMVMDETVARCIVLGGCTIGTVALDNDDSHLYVSIQTGQLFEIFESTS
ncbi:hypothetical protein CBR_g78867 [Chara braunii]|uniref:SMP-30/Gluconolactonase/LRE-like region domain-containing protein n=1 Tax=Chara braunii TaxID=69332 RepID=A0A388KAR0_CHABU|nr:hypothetical protein CBR_g78867 [Chara braunii]|eukprot:GBG67086.1 hypothetical protein CBR_g78867 [Chara braunii]